MKPMMILPPGLMSKADIELIRENGICVAVASDPTKVKFIDPIPAASSRSQIEDAAIKLSRILLNGQWGNFYNSSQLGKSEFSVLFLKCLLQGTPLDPKGTLEERRDDIIAAEKAEEYRRIAPRRG